MKKLNCTSCGGHLEVESNNEYAFCRYCGARYKLNENLDINFKVDDSVKDVLKGGFRAFKFVSKMALIPIFLFFIAFIVVTLSVFKIIGSEGFQEQRQKETFNVKFVNGNGTNQAMIVKRTLDNIIQSNKTNTRQITLVYEGKSITGENEIIDIKHSLDGEYEVSYKYNDSGYIKEIKVDKIK